MSDIISALNVTDKSTGLWKILPDRNRYFGVWIWDATEHNLTEIQQLLERLETLISVAYSKVLEAPDAIEMFSEEVEKVKPGLNKREIMKALKLRHISVFFDEKDTEISFDYHIPTIETRSIVCIRLDTSGNLNSSALES